MHANGHAKCMQSQQCIGITDVTEYCYGNARTKVGSCSSRKQAAESPFMHMPHGDRLQAYRATTLCVPSETDIPKKDT